MKTLVGYSDSISVAPGDAVAFKISSEDGAAFTARIVRLIHGDTNPAGPGYKERPVPSAVDGRYPGRRQPVHAGSCGVVSAAPILRTLGSFAVRMRIWPTTPGCGEQVLASLWDDARGAGFQLLLDAAGALAFRLGDGRGGRALLSTGRRLVARQWYSVGASFDAEAGRALVLQTPRAPHPFMNDEGGREGQTGLDGLGEPDAPLVFAARPAGLHYEAHYNGKIDSPALYARALNGEALGSRDRDPAEGRVAFWDFAADISGTRLTDRGPHGLHGRTHQMPARGVTGYGWTPDRRRWADDPPAYGAIHFHDDDIYDAGWRSDFSWTVPEDAPSGLYAAHVSNDGDEDYIPFVVRAPKARAAAAVLVLPTASYLAYGNEHLAVDAPLAERAHDLLTVFYPADIFLAQHREYGGSLYDCHSDGSGIMYSSRLRPLLNMRPKYQSWLGGSGSALWQLNADTHLIDWLEHEGVAFDILTDEDIEREGAAALAPYRCLVTGTHAEYFSTRMWDAFEAFKAGGGRLMAMGGNAFHGRIAFHPEIPGVIEIRRCEVGNGWLCPPGESYHSFDGEYGGLWRRFGRPSQTMAGVGFTGQGFDICSYYRRRPGADDARAAFIFDGVSDEIIGQFGLIGGGAAGIELDRADYALGTPAHALVLATSENHTSIYMLSTCEMMINMPGLDATQCPQVHADLVFYETAAGGAVFGTGSIAWSGSLSHDGYDNNVARITANVLHRFLDPRPFEPGSSTQERSAECASTSP